MNETDKHSMFMAAALSGMLAHSRRYKPRPGDPVNWHQAIAREAREIADAMVAESHNATNEGADND